MSEENSKQRLIFRFNEIVDTINNYKAHLKIASELEIRRDMERLGDMLSGAAYDNLDVDDIYRAILRTDAVYDRLTDIEFALEMKKLDADREQCGCHTHDDKEDSIGEAFFCDECEYIPESLDCLRFKNSKYYAYSIYKTPEVKKENE